MEATSRDTLPEVEPVLTALDVDVLGLEPAKHRAVHPLEHGLAFGFFESIESAVPSQTDPVGFRFLSTFNGIQEFVEAIHRARGPCFLFDIHFDCLPREGLCLRFGSRKHAPWLRLDGSRSVPIGSCVPGKEEQEHNGGECIA